VLPSAFAQMVVEPVDLIAQWRHIGKRGPGQPAGRGAVPDRCEGGAPESCNRPRVVAACLVRSD
jgi:hypothetical protein